MKHLFTSESIGEGHPDKVADQISDAILDACLAQDKNSRVACETFTTTGLVLIGGEITTNGWINFQEIARNMVRKIGYTNPEYGLDADSMAVIDAIGQQSPDIAQGVNKKNKKIGAGDQGLMFGFACDETPELMPAPVMLSHKILQKASELRHKNKADFGWLRPDAKCQVTLEYDDEKIVGIDTVVVSHQHDPVWKNKPVTQSWIAEQVKEFIIAPVLEPTGLLNKKIKYHINPTGRFVQGGPHADAGLTGRKIIADTYGGMGRHGGGAFSGKDPSKVDRSAAYMARYVAKNIVAAKLAKKCEVQLAYAIGVEAPVSLAVDTFGTGKVEDSAISKAISKVFDLTPLGIITTLDLLRPIYKKTAVYGHFGKKGKEFTWEATNKKEDIKKAIK